MLRIGSQKPLKWYLREWRERRGLTQEQVAERLDTTKGMVSQFENGKRRLNDDWICGFAHVFGIDPADLLRNPQSPHPMQLLDELTQSQRESIMHMIGMFKNAAR